MKHIADKIKKLWTEFKNAANADNDLKAAIEKHDIEAARTAINNARPADHTYYDGVIGAIREYVKSESTDQSFLNALREAAYNAYDEKIRIHGPEKESASDPEAKSGYKHPYHIYGMAAYMNDVNKLKELGAKGITPDKASDLGGCNENIIMGAANLGCFDAMKEVIHQGASLDEAFGWDEFPPIHTFSKPLFHALTPGVTKALLETGNKRIIEAVEKAVGKQNLPPPPPHNGPNMHP